MEMEIGGERIRTSRPGQGCQSVIALGAAYAWAGRRRVDVDVDVDC